LTKEFILFEIVRFLGPPEFCPAISVGDEGAVVEVYGNGWYEVEFIFDDGSTKAIQAFSNIHLAKSE
jgi:Domain of unknown function (DUF4926)